MGGKIGVLVDVETDVVNDDVKEMARMLQWSGCSIKATYTTSSSEVSADYIAMKRDPQKIMDSPKNTETGANQNILTGMVTDVSTKS